MTNYQKPMILKEEELVEGIYMASGDVISGTGCNSIYMRGVYHPNTRGQNVIDPANDPDSAHTLLERGCEGCPYNWGWCAVNDDNAFPGQDSRPDWERKGHRDTDPYDSI